MSDAMQTPLIELMRRVPQDARGVYEHHSTSHSFIPYGRYCHEAADIIATQQARMAELEAERDHLERELAEYVDAAKRLAVEKAEFRREAEKLQAELAALREAAQYAADVICLPGPHDYYHSTQDWEAMKELRAALLKQGEQR